MLPVALLSCVFAAAVQDKPQIPSANVVIVHARIYTQNPQQPWAEALAIRGEKIVAVGSESEIAAYRGAKTRVIDAGGHLLLPGFTDCHIHFLDGSLSLMQVRLDQAKTVKDIQIAIKRYAAAHPGSGWILGRGWQYTTFGDSGMPTRALLDQVVPDRPVYMESFDGHSWWANSKALKLAGISRETKDPPGGSFVRDPATGEPTGAVKEDAADAAVRRVVPEPSHKEVLEALRRGMREANRVGLVRGISPGGVSVRGGDFTALDAYDELRRSGQLTMRFYIGARIEPPTLANQMQKIKDARSRYHDEWLSAGAAKFFLDGVIESHTAAMLAPYADDPGKSGSLWWDPENYEQAVAELEGSGVQVYTHAIGDRAVRLALDAYEAASKSGRTHDPRPRIEHIETISARDIPRFGQLGVVASFQPLHAYPDDDIEKAWAPHVGPERAQRAWAWRSIEQTGGVLAFGSDWPIVTQNPWLGVQNALTRQTTEGTPTGGFVPGERISLADAVKGYTLGAAYAGHREKEEGSLEAGKLADLIVVDRDLFKIEPSEIGKTVVLLTMVGGRVVYESKVWHSHFPAGTSK